MDVVTERVEWNHVLQQFSNANDIYYNYDYFDIYVKNFGVKSEAVVWLDQYISIFWSHLIREIPNTFDNPLISFDLISPYGYGGPLINCKTNNRLNILNSLRSFIEEYLEFARSNNYICEFIRFHPILRNWELFSDGFQNIIALDHSNDTVYVDLSTNLDQIWQGIRKGHRYNIKKTMHEGCEAKILLNPSDSDIDEFISLYYSTMKKCQASKKYFFQPTFIKDHFSQLSATLVRIDYDELLIGASMFIAGKSCIHYHLSGSNNTIKGIYPSELILWSVIKWAKEKNLKYFHLGGGLKINDSLFGFKNGFSNKKLPFYTGRILFDYEKYEILTKSCNNTNLNQNFFPAYRNNQNDAII